MLSLSPTEGRQQCGEVAWSVWFQLRTFLSDHGSQEVEVEEQEKEEVKKKNLPAGWTGEQSFIWGITGLFIWALVSWWYPTWSSLVDRSLSASWISPRIKVCFLSRACEWSVRKQETCQTDVSVTCWGESGCCGCGKVSPGTVCRMFFKSSSCPNSCLNTKFILNYSHTSTDFSAVKLCRFHLIEFIKKSLISQPDCDQIFEDKWLKRLV